VPGLWIMTACNTGLYSQWWRESLSVLNPSPLLSLGWPNVTQNIVSCRPVTRRRPRNRRPYSGPETTGMVSARQQLNCNIEECCFLRAPCRNVIHGTGWELQGSQSEVQAFGVRWSPAWESVRGMVWVGRRVSDLRGLLQFSRCELLLQEVGSRGRG
jgi:hypothetical protein